MGKDENCNRQIKTANDIKLNNGFNIHRKFLEAIYYGRKIAKKIFPLNYSPEMGKFKKGIQSENGETKEQGALE